MGCINNDRQQEAEILSRITQAEIWEQSKQKGSVLLLLLAIGDFANDEGIAFPSVKTLATRTKLSERCVQYTIQRLTRSGEICVDRGKGPHGCNLIRVHVLHLVCTNCTAKFAPGVQEVCTGGVQIEAERGAPAIAPNPRRTIKQKRKETQASPADPRFQPFVAFVYESRPDLIVGPADFRALKTLLDASRDKPMFALEKLQEYWTRFQNSPNKFHREQGKPLQFFCLNINAFVNGNGNGKHTENPNTRAAQDFVSRKLAETLRRDIPDVREDPRRLS